MKKENIVEKTCSEFATRNKLQNLDNQEILTLAEGKRIDQINNTPIDPSISRKIAKEIDDYGRHIFKIPDYIYRRKLCSYDS